MLFLADPEKPRPQRNLGCQVERVTHHRADRVMKPSRRPGAGIDDLPPQFGPLRRHHQLLGDPPGAGNSVRSDSWRPTTSANAALNACASRRPPKRNATAKL